jgi:hypothetical protein
LPRLGVNPSWHPLGFIVFRISESSQFSLRMHVWPADGLRPAEPFWPIHNHVFTVKSYLIAGQLRNTTYKIKPARDGTHRLYEVSYSSQGTLIQPTTHLINISSHRDETQLAGKFYTVPEGAFHSTTSGTGILTATFVITEKSGKLTRPIVVGDTEPRTWSCPSRPLDEEEISRCLNLMALIS